jgi:hypothetical protein
LGRGGGKGREGGGGGGGRRVRERGEGRKWNNLFHHLCNWEKGITVHTILEQ